MDEKKDESLSLRVPPEWKRRLKMESVIRDMSMTKIIVQAVDEWLKRHPVEKEG